MGERTAYAPGTFSWVDLSTTDVPGAKGFYGELFGWEAEDMPAGEAGTYTFFRLGGRDAAAVAQQREEERSQGIPPHWNSYITVDDLDARAARARELGGTVLAEPFDVLEAGRMAVVQDPTGAVFFLWEPKDHIGASVVNEPGAFTWNDLMTRDAESAKRFYADLFGWTTEDVPAGPGGAAYSVIRNGDSTNGGLMQMDDEAFAGVPPHWNVYFAVARCEDTIETAERLGGQVVAPPMEVPVGRFAVIRDPQGASFSIFEGELDP